MKSLLRRSCLVAVLFGSHALWGCAENNESEFAKNPGITPPDAPQTAEEYELKHKPKSRTP
jgi:hypothetical protein